jgi:uncharacterized RDD family membrane protein YckC
MDQESTTDAPAGLFRRLAAFFYDLLLAIAIAFIATAAMLPLAHGEAILTATQGFVGHLYHAVLLFAVFTYFGRCWTRSGQTLGMKAWRIRIESNDGRRLGWGAAILRFVLGAAVAWMAVIGAWYLRRPEGPLAIAAAIAMIVPAILNFAWIPIGTEGRSLQDYAGHLRVVRTN